MKKTLMVTAAALFLASQTVNAHDTGVQMYIKIYDDGGNSEDQLQCAFIHPGGGVIKADTGVSETRLINVNTTYVPNKKAVREVHVHLKDWSPEIRLDTDETPGGCQYSMAIVDHDDELGSDPKLFINWRLSPTSGGDDAQCGGVNVKAKEIAVPVTAKIPQYSEAIRIDADFRHGYCELWFTVKSPDFELNVRFWEEYETGFDQCVSSQPKGAHKTVRMGSAPYIMGLNMREKRGGCRQQLQLRKIR